MKDTYRIKTQNDVVKPETWPKVNTGAAKWVVPHSTPSWGKWPVCSSRR